MAQKFEFEPKAGVNTVATTLPGGRAIEISDTYTTTDPSEAEALRSVNGLKEVSSTKKGN